MMINKGTVINNSIKNKQKKRRDQTKINKCSQFTVIIFKQKRCTTKLSRRLFLSTVSSLSVTLSIYANIYLPYVLLSYIAAISRLLNMPSHFDLFYYTVRQTEEKNTFLSIFLHNILKKMTLYSDYFPLGSGANLLNFTCNNVMDPKDVKRY